ncbi:nuclear transport factor 2 family protein [Pseudonocardia sp. KRD291]|uniref:nuclear transport factor 2 family protein n=1 Tax=Pseudonocardia sp. KRD291 TaxID=2792007 RepID=UPI001C49F550|nr:nuclear transport factor 2 family protein [Pseudonocardia sp. KRD291]MBW0102395.1 hypothetical protein [Pseudonocardia sp. KRD291]
MFTRLAGAAGAAVLVAVLTSCSGAATEDAPAAPDPAAQARDAVRATFTGYAQALLARDFPGACAALTDQAAKALVDDVNTKNIPARTCDQAYAALYVTEAATTLDESNRTVRVTDVTVDGDAATLTYTGSVKGRALPPQTVRAQQVGGRWRIAPAN